MDRRLLPVPGREAPEEIEQSVVDPTEWLEDGDGDGRVEMRTRRLHDSPAALQVLRSVRRRRSRRAFGDTYRGRGTAERDEGCHEPGDRADVPGPGHQRAQGKGRDVEMQRHRQSAD